jgi:MscS family membrane protein
MAQMTTKSATHFANILITAFFILVFGLSDSTTAAEVNPLRPVDASSPRATLQGFIETIDEAYLGMTDFLKSYAASNRLYLSAEERKRQSEILSNGTKAVQFLDTSRISPVLKDTVAVERALQLKEILDRIELPAFDAIPDRDAIARSSAKKWRLPNTEIDIVLIENGPRAGDWLVSADTVDRVPAFYEEVRDLPYKPGPAKQAADAYRALSSNRTTTIYEAFTSSPVGLEAIIPTRWMLSLPVWAKAEIAGVTLWQWFGFVFGFLVGLLFVFGVYRLARRLARQREAGAAAGWHSVLAPLAIILLAGVLGPLICKILRISGSPLVVIAFVQTITLYVSAAWLSLIGAGILGESVVASERLRPQSLDSQLIRLACASSAS